MSDSMIKSKVLSIAILFLGLTTLISCGGGGGGSSGGGGAGSATQTPTTTAPTAPTGGTATTSPGGVTTTTQPPAVTTTTTSPGGGTTVPTVSTTTSPGGFIVPSFPTLQNPLSSRATIRSSVYFTMADQMSPYIGGTLSGSNAYDGINIYSLDTIPPVNLSTGHQTFQHTLHLEKAKLAAVSDEGHIFSYILNPNTTGAHNQFLLIVSKLDDPNFQSFEITTLGKDDSLASVSYNGMRLAVLAQDPLGNDEVKIFDIDYTAHSINDWTIGVPTGQSVTEYFVIDPYGVYLYIAMKEGLGHFLARYDVSTLITSQSGEKFLDLNLAISVNNALSVCVDTTQSAIKISEIKRLYLWYDTQSALFPMFTLIWNSADHMFMLPVEVGGMTLIGGAPISSQQVIDNRDNVVIAGCFGSVGPYNITTPVFSMKEAPKNAFILSSKSTTIADKFMGIFSPQGGQFHRQDISHDIIPQSGFINSGSANPILETSDYILNIMAP